MGLGHGIRNPGSGKNLFRIPDPGPGVKMAPDPGSRIRIRNTDLTYAYLYNEYRSATLHR
jgi:hypothetical protein